MFTIHPSSNIEAGTFLVAVDTEQGKRLVAEYDKHKARLIVRDDKGRAAVCPVQDLFLGALRALSKKDVAEMQENADEIEERLKRLGGHGVDQPKEQSELTLEPEDTNQ